MPSRCAACGADNPAGNRFCGQCGARLSSAPPELPEEFQETGGPALRSAAELAWDEVSPEHDSPDAEPAADLPSEVIELDTHIPLIADDGADRRIYNPPEIVEEIHQRLEREAEQHDQLHHSGEIHAEVRAREEERERSALDFPLHEEPETASDARASTRNGRTGVSGPSILGISDDPTFDYEEPPPPERHLGRNVAIAVLAAVAVLAAIQWRTIRDAIHGGQGSTYAQGGSAPVPPSSAQPAKQPPAAAADNTSRELASKPPSPAAAPVESTPNAGRELPPPKAGSGDANAAAPGTSPAPAPPSMSEPARRSSGADTAEGSNATASASRPEVSGAGSTRTAAEESSIPPRVPKPPAGRAATPAQPAAPGAEEMMHAANSSDAEARAVWLWRAVAKGNIEAPIELAAMYEMGVGVVQSCDQAQVLLRLAASKGNTQAQANLARLRCPH